jgi:hypothetical protein
MITLLVLYLHYNDVKRVVGFATRRLSHFKVNALLDKKDRDLIFHSASL